MADAYMPNALPLRKKESHIDTSHDTEFVSDDNRTGSMREVKAVAKAVGSPSGKIDKSKNDNGQIPKYPQA